MSASCGIAIVGGGLAGLAAARALATFGMKAQVFEAAPALGEIGAAVNVSPQLADTSPSGFAPQPIPRAATQA